MYNKNKKFWSLIFGAILANSYVWLVSLGSNAPVPELLQTNSAFVAKFYSPIVIGSLSALLVLALSVFMHKVFNVSVNEHAAWIYWPTLGFIVFTALTATELVMPILQAAVPALFVLTIIYIVQKRQQFMLFKNSSW